MNGGWGLRQGAQRTGLERQPQANRSEQGGLAGRDSGLVTSHPETPQFVG